MEKNNTKFHVKKATKKLSVVDNLQSNKANLISKSF